MIVLTDKRAAVESILETEGSHDDPPPNYSSLPPQSGHASRAMHPSTMSPCSSKPSNYVSISRTNGIITGEWLLDPSLSIPASLLPPSSVGEETMTRKNMFLETMNGAIDADVHIAPCRDQAGSSATQVVLHARSYNGNITLKLHDPPSPFLSRPIINITTSTTSGFTHVYVPRTFRGPLIIKSYNSQVRFSDMLLAQLTTFSEANFTHRCFLGDLTELYESDGAEWQGDQLDVDTRSGAVMMQFDDEPPMSENAGNPFGNMGGLHNPFLQSFVGGFPHQHAHGFPFNPPQLRGFGLHRGRGFGFNPPSFFSR